MTPTTRGQRVRQKRKALGMTQHDLAKRAGVEQPTISDLERDVTQSVSAATMLRVAAVLETNPHYLMTGRGDPDAMLPEGSSAQLLEIFSSLTPTNQAAALAAASALLDSQKS